MYAGDSYNNRRKRREILGFFWWGVFTQGNIQGSLREMLRRLYIVLGIEFNLIVCNTSILLVVLPDPGKNVFKSSKE